MNCAGCGKARHFNGGQLCDSFHFGGPCSCGATHTGDRGVHVETPYAVPAFARFRADPAKVRVRVRRCENGTHWSVEVSSGGMAVYRADTGPRKALVRALRAAEAAGLPGIDLGMGRAYEHPWGGR